VGYYLIQFPETPYQDLNGIGLAAIHISSCLYEPPGNPISLDSFVETTGYTDKWLTDKIQSIMYVLNKYHIPILPRSLHMLDFLTQQIVLDPTLANNEYFDLCVEIAQYLLLMLSARGDFYKRSVEEITHTTLKITFNQMEQSFGISLRKDLVIQLVVPEIVMRNIKKMLRSWS
jgi:hypothetical protein